MLWEPSADEPVTTWSLDGDDAGDFMIGNDGMLKFKSSPDYEMPMDKDEDNTYMVTVKAEAGGEMDMMDVTVTVTDMDETGMVSLSESRPVVGVCIDRHPVGPGLWRNRRDVAVKRTSMDKSAWTEITGATTDSYTVMADDEDYYLRATVTYDDVHGTGKDVMATYGRNG